MRGGGVEFNYVWDCADLEAGGVGVPGALAGFGVPELDAAVIRGGEEVGTEGVEVDG